MNKRAILLTVKLALIFIIITLIAILMINASRHIINSEEASTEASTTPIVIIDPGHGGIDGGAVGVNGCKEKDINLAISLKVYDLLNESGIDCELTRTSDILLCDNAPSGKKKLTDLNNRLNKLNSYDNSLLVSIHLNTNPQKSCTGAQLYYSPNNEDSKTLAQIMQNKFISELQPDNKRQPKEANSSIYLLYHSSKVCVLAECGFISNSEEAEQLCSEEYQAKIAQVISNSITKYIGWKNEGQ